MSIGREPARRVASQVQVPKTVLRQRLTVNKLHIGTLPPETAQLQTKLRTNIVGKHVRASESLIGRSRGNNRL